MALSGQFNLRYNEKYLSYIEEDSELHGFLQFSGDDPLSIYSKFEVKMAKTAEGFFSIRSVFSDKYWVCRLKNDKYWIVAEADEPNEDQSSLSCTLFEQLSVNKLDANAIQLRHVNLDMLVQVSEPSSLFPPCIFAATPGTGSNVFEFSILVDDLTSHQCAFKGDNGKYLRVVNNGSLYLKFSAEDIDDISAWFECHHNDNSAYIESELSKLFLSYDPKSKCVLADHSSPGQDTLFNYIKIQSPDNRDLIILCKDNFYYQRCTKPGDLMDCLVKVSHRSLPAILEVVTKNRSSTTK